MSSEQLTTRNNDHHSTEIDVDAEASVLLSRWLPIVGALPHLISVSERETAMRALVAWYERVLATKDYDTEPPIEGLDALVDELATVAVAPKDHTELARGRWAIRVAEELVAWRRCLRDDGAESIPTGPATDRLELAIVGAQRHIAGPSTTACELSCSHTHLSTMNTESTTPLRSALGEIDLDAPGASAETLVAVAELAIEIAREGREGRRVGTIFTIGAEDDVLAQSETLILDPLAGHAAARLSVHDPDLRETVKELAQLDGGFVVSGEGTLLSACRYFEAHRRLVKQPLGLGSRHIAAASISASTGAIAIVVSESSIVRIYSHGRLVKEILPEVWLLRRHMSRITSPSLTRDEAENLAILGDDAELGHRASGAV